MTSAGPGAGQDMPDPGQTAPDTAAGPSVRPALGSHDATAGQPVAARPAAPGPAGPEQSREDTDIAWGDYPSRDDEDRLYRDRPPHWADH